MKPVEFQGVRLYGEEGDSETKIISAVTVQTPNGPKRYKAMGVARRHPKDGRDRNLAYGIALVRSLEELASTLRDRIKEQRGIDF